MAKPLAIDLFCGLGGWTEALLAEGWDVIGFDIERHDYGKACPMCGGSGRSGAIDDCIICDRTGHIPNHYPGQLVLMDVCQIHGAMFKDADLIVASPPCQEFSYRAMPWKRAKALPPPLLGTNLFWQCWRIQHEACEAAGRYIPMVVENVRGAQKWVGRAKAEYGSFMLWGDVRRIGRRIVKAEQPRFGMEAVAAAKRIKSFTGSPGKIWSDRDPASSWSGTHGVDGRKLSRFNFHQHENGKPGGSFQSAAVDEKGFAKNWRNSPNGMPMMSSKSSARKAASAQIAKIPYPLAQHIARVFKP